MNPKETDNKTSSPRDNNPEATNPSPNPDGNNKCGKPAADDHESPPYRGTGAPPVQKLRSNNTAWARRPCHASANQPAPRFHNCGMGYQPMLCRNKLTLFASLSLRNQ